MSPRSRRAILASGLFAATVWTGWLAAGLLDGPWGMVPGGRLAGPSKPCESAGWERFAAVRQVQLEVRPEHPRSMTTWSVVHDGELFVPADFLTPWKRWPHQVLEDGRVRLRVGEEVFACRAERVEDEVLIGELRGVAARKYELDPDGREARVEVWWFRLRPR